MTFIDIYTGWVYLLPLKSKHSIRTTKGLHVFVCTFGKMNILITDDGDDFDNLLILDYTEQLGIHHHITEEYVHSHNGRVERKHREIDKYLRLFGIIQQKDFSYQCKDNNWDEYLPSIFNKCNNSLDIGTQFTARSLVITLPTHESRY